MIVRNSYLFLLMVTAFLMCSQSGEEATAPEMQKTEVAETEDFVAGTKAASAPQRRSMEKKPAPGRESFPVRFTEASISADRLLEYRVTLNFESTEFFKSRKLLYELAGQYGFLKRSSDSFEPYHSLNSEVYVKSAELYEFLKATDQLGKLLSENIQTDDLTFSQFENQLKLEREQVRSARRAAALRGAPTAKNYVERERLLTQSENQEDYAKKEQWKVNDRVKWAKVSVTIEDPRAEPGVSVPDFRGIIYDLATLALYLLYVMAYILPVAALGFGVYLIVRKIMIRK